MSADRLVDRRPPCDGRCLMANEVLPIGGLVDVAAAPHPDCPRHGAVTDPGDDRRALTPGT